MVAYHGSSTGIGQCKSPQSACGRDIRCIAVPVKQMMKVSNFFRTRRVLFIGADARYMYRFRHAVIQDFIARGFEVSVATPVPKGFQPPFGFVRQIDWQIHKANLNPFAEVTAVYDLFRILCSEKPDVVFAHTIKPIIYGMPLAALTGVKTRCALIPGLGYAFGDEKSIRRGVSNLAARVGYGAALARANVIFLQNDDDRKTLSTLKLLPRQSMVHVLSGSGLDMTHFVRRPLPASPPFTFLLVSRLIREKGIVEFVNAARIVNNAVPRCRFVVVGAPDKVPSAIPESQIATWRNEGIVEFQGHVDDPRPEYAACHVFVLPSFYREGCPRANLEAMATGRALITTDWVGCRDTVIDGINGLLVPPRDHKALADAMIRLARNSKTVARMGEASWEFCRSRFELDVVTRQITHGVLTAMS